MSRTRAVLIFVALAAACSSKSSSAPEQGSTSAKPEPAPAPAPEQIDPPAAPGSLGGQLAADGGGLLATWLEPAAVDSAGAGSTRRGPHRVRFARLAGGAWSKPVTIAEGDSVLANWADTPSVVRGGDGVLVAHWAQRREGGAYAYDVALARSTDDGVTWTPLGLAHDDGTATEHGFVSLVPAPAGARAFWLDGREMAGGAHGGHGAGPMTLRTALVGEAVTGGAVVDARVCDCCGTAAVATASGAAVAYRNRSDGEVRDVWLSRETDDGWTAPAPVHDDQWEIPGCPVNGPAMAAAGDQMVVAWYTYAGARGAVRAAFSDDGGASFAAPIEIDGPRGRVSPIGRVDVELVGAGEAVVTWMSSDREDAGVFARRVAASGRVGAPLRIYDTAAARDAGFPRIARLGDSLGVMYTETGDGTRVRFRVVPLSAVPAADAAPPAPRPDETGLLAVGSSLPRYEVDKLDGTRGSVADLAGGVTLVNLWATWCEPCRQEMPVLAELQRTHADAGLRVVAISVDRDRAADELTEFAARRELPFSIWHDAEDRSSAAFGVGALPASFLFDRSGTLVWRRAGAVAAGDEELAAALATALATQ